MSKKQTNSVHEKFVFDEKSNTSKCRICDKIMKGKHATNLLKHLNSSHTTEYAEVSTENLKRIKLGNATKHKHQEQISNIFEKSNIHVNMTPTILKSALVEMITKNGRPLCIVEDSGFRKIIDPILDGFASSITINRFNIRELIKHEANMLRQTISRKLENKIISIKIDGASKMDRSVLGINVQILEDNRIKIITLAMTDIKTRSTSENLNELLKNVLVRYKVDIQQVYTITTDNGSNMIKCTKLLSTEQAGTAAATATVDDILNDSFGSNMGFDDDEMLHEFKVDFLSPIITAVRCVAHTFQLAIKKFTNEKSVDRVIQKAKAVARKLRTPTFIALIKKQNLKKPLLDCPTRWSSTYLMLERLQTLKDFCDVMDEKDLKLTESEWINIQNILNVLLPAHKASKTFQIEQLTLSDVYCTWTKCKINLDSMNNAYAKIIVNAMNQKEEHFMSEPMLACLYLDPRFQIMLTELQKQQAKQHLFRLYVHMDKLEKNIVEVDSTVSTDDDIMDSQVIDAVNSSEHDGEYDDFEVILAEMEKADDLIQNQHLLVDQPQISNTVAFKKILHEFNNIKRIPVKSSILEYWASQQHVSPELYKISQIIYAVPGTQVSVERAFSSFNFIFTDKRNSIDENLLDDILFLRLNK